MIELQTSLKTELINAYKLVISLVEDLPNFEEKPEPIALTFTGDALQTFWTITDFWCILFSYIIHTLAIIFHTGIQGRCRLTV